MSRRPATTVAFAALAALLLAPQLAYAADPLETQGRPGGARVEIDDVAALDFGEVQIHSTSTPQDYVYTNPTAGDLDVVASLTGADIEDFAISADTCAAAPVPASGNCTVSVTFTPTAEYGRTATLSFSDGTVGAPTVSLGGIGVLPESAVAWGAARLIGSARTWTQGAALARTVSGSVQYLHALVQRYDIAREGIYYRRSTTGTTWAYGNRLNSTTQYAGRSTIAASGSYVYAAWSSFASANPTGTQPRVLYFRSNKTHGSGTWSTVKRLTATTSRIDYPRLAASGSAVYITYTDSATGAIKILISKDRGVTWRSVSLGSSTRMTTSGRFGAPVVAAYGTTVSVAWISSASGAVRFRSSTNYGATWSSTLNLTTSGAEVGSRPSIAAVGTRIAVAWTGASSMQVRVRTGSTWGPTRSVEPSAGGAHPYVWPWIGQVALTGTTRVGIAWEECWVGCGVNDPLDQYRADVLWRESADNGASWTRSQVVVRTGIDADFEYEYAYYPSVLWPTATTRYVMTSRWYGPNMLDNVVFKVGTGAP